VFSIITDKTKIPLRIEVARWFDVNQYVLTGHGVNAVVEFRLAERKSPLDYVNAASVFVQARAALSREGSCLTEND
jgi:hypothetical protein